MPGHVPSNLIHRMHRSSLCMALQNRTREPSPSAAFGPLERQKASFRDLPWSTDYPVGALSTTAQPDDSEVPPMEGTSWVKNGHPSNSSQAHPLMSMAMKSHDASFLDGIRRYKGGHCWTATDNPH